MSIKFKIGALTDVGLVRTNNEDNYLVIPDLTVTTTGSDTARMYDLGPNGALMVVADGMGGMNAGEVASEIAVNSIKAAFSPVRITPQVLKSAQTIERFMDDAIIEADAKIKAAAMRNSESQGMGTTIVVAWILGGKLYAAWCGDSRAYVFNSTGLHQLTKDHSYVQSLVDQGQLTRDEAFDSPQSNVITRSLCDSPDPAEPENLFKPYTLANGDTIILCTDGVSGMLRDKQLEDVIGSSPDDLDSLMASIKSAVEGVGAADNFTMCITQIADGAQALAEPDTEYFKTTEAMLNGKLPSPKSTKAGKPAGKLPWRLVAIVGIVAVLVAVAAALLLGGKDSDDQSEKKADTEQTDQQTQETPNQNTRPSAQKPAKAPAPAKTQTATPEKSEGSGIVEALSGSGKTDETDTQQPAEPKKPSAASAIGQGLKPSAEKPAEPTAVPTPSPTPAPKPTPTPAPTPTPSPGE